MHPQPLSPAETRLLQAFRALPASAQKQIFRSLEEITEALEDEQDLQDAENLLARIKSGDEEVVPFDDVVKGLGFPPRKHPEK